MKIEIHTQQRIRIRDNADCDERAFVRRNQYGFLLAFFKGAKTFVLPNGFTVFSRYRRVHDCDSSSA